MKLAVNDNTINPNTSNVGITVNSLTYSMIIDGIYTNKLNSTIREISTNARDSHIEAGNQDKFDIYIEPFSDGQSCRVRIRDYGTGLTEEEARTFLCTLNESSKRESDNAIGCFGIGSKSVFTVTDNYQYFCHKGDTTTFITFNREDKSTPSYEIISYPNESEKDGVEVIFECKYRAKDIVMAIEEELMFFDILPNVYISSADEPKNYVLQEDVFPKVEDRGDYFLVDSSSENFDRNYVVIGTVKYRYSLSNVIRSSLYYHPKYSYFLKFDVTDGLTFDISRENITSSPHNSKIIKEKVEKVSQEVSSFIKLNLKDYYNISLSSYFALKYLTARYAHHGIICDFRDLDPSLPNISLDIITIKDFKRYVYNFAQSFSTWDEERVKELDVYSILAKFLDIPTFKNIEDYLKFDLLKEVAEGSADNYVQKSQIIILLKTVLENLGLNPKVRFPNYNRSSSLKDIVVFYNHKPSFYSAKELEDNKLYYQSTSDDTLYSFIQLPLRDHPVLIDTLEQLSEMFDLIKFYPVSEETAKEYSFISDWFKPKQKKTVTVSLPDEESSIDVEVSSSGVPLRTNLELTYYVNSDQKENPTCITFFKYFEVSTSRKAFIYLDDFPLDESQRNVFGRFVSRFSNAVVIFSQDVPKESFSLLELTLEKATINRFIVISYNKDLFSTCSRDVVSIYPPSFSQFDRIVFFNYYLSYCNYLASIEVCKETYKVLCEEYSSDENVFGNSYFSSTTHLSNILKTIEVNTTEVHKKNIQLFLRSLVNNAFDSKLTSWSSPYPENLSLKAMTVYFLIQASPLPVSYGTDFKTFFAENSDIVDKLYDFLLEDKSSLLNTIKATPNYTVQDLRDIYEFTFKKSDRDVSSSASE